MSQTVAKGSVVLTLDSSQLNAGMKKAAQKAKSDGKGIAGNFKEGSKDFLKDATGGDRGIVGGLGKAGLIGAGIAGAVMLGKALFESFGPAKRLRREIEELSATNEKWRDGVKESIDVQKAWVDSLDDIAGTAEGAARIQSHYAQIGQSAEQLDAKLKTAKKAQEEYNDPFSLDALGDRLMGVHDDRKKAIEEETAALKEDAKAAKKAAEAWKLKGEMQKIAADKGTREFVQSMKDAVAIANDATTADLVRIEAMRRGNPMITEAQVAEMKRAAAMKDAAEAAKKLREEQEAANKEARDLASSLEEELGLAIKRTTEEKQLDELVSKGIDKDQADRLRALIQLKKVQSQEFKPLNALVRGSAAEITFQNKTKFEEQRDKDNKQLLEEIKKLNKISAETRDATVKIEKKDAPVIP